MVLKASDSPCKDVILKALTRLNEKSTSRAAAEELSIIVRDLDHDSLSALVQSICSTTGAWEPKPVAKKEGVRVLAQLPLPSCPVADVALQQLLPRILGYLKKTLQDTDGLVREASSEALAAYALGATRSYGCEVPGSTASPVVKVVFDSLAEQKKEAQMGASQALLKMSPYLGPLDKDLVKFILKLLRSPSFLGTAQLLAAIASTDAEQKAPVGLLKHGTAAFLPFINHLIGQPQQQQRRSSSHSSHEAAGASSGGGSSASLTMTASSKPLSASGILGCLSSPDWAVRRAAADAVRAVVLLVGPGLEPEECWGLGDPGSVTGRCLNALEDCRFDKVKEAREAAREAAALIHQLHQFVSEQGSDGDWPAWASSNLPYSGWQSPACSPPRSPMGRRSSGSLRPLSSRQPMSPIAARFRSAAVDTDVIVEPGSRVTQGDEADTEGCDTALCDAAAAAAGSGMLHPDEDGCVAVMLVADGAVLAGQKRSSSDPMEDSQHDSAGPDGDLAAEHSSVSVSSSQPEPTGRALSKQTSQQAQQRMQASSSGGGVPAGLSRTSRTSGSRPGSAHASRPTSAAGSAASSRTSTHDQQAPLGRESSSGAVSGAVPSYAAGTRSSTARGSVPQQAAAGSRGASRCPVPGTNKARGSIAKQQPAAAWQGPTQQEWEQQQLQVLEQQQLVTDLQQQLAGMQMQHSQEQQSLKDANLALQERLAALEVQVQQQQQQVIQEEQHKHLQDLRQRTLSIPAAPRSPVRSISNPSTGSSMAAAAAYAISSPVAALAVSSPRAALAVNSPVTALANSPVAGVLRSPGRDGQQQRLGVLSEGPPSSSRLYKSAEWGSPHGGGSPVKAFVSPIDPMGVGRHSFNSLTTPTSAGGCLKGCDSTVATPGDLEAAYAEAVRGAKGSVHLLRLTQKTGPVWGQLSEHTCQALLEVFIKNVRDGVMLHRVLPWLWRLADEDAGRPHVPEGLQQQLLEALESCPAAEDMQAQERVCLLLDTLKAVWNVK